MSKLILSILMCFLWMAVPSIASAKTNLTKVAMDETLRCVASAIYHEARGERSRVPKLHVGLVVLNRTHYPKLFAPTACGVVHQKVRVGKKHHKRVVCQFSWFCHPQLRTVKEWASYDDSLDMAREAMAIHRIVGSTDELYFTSARAYDRKRLRNPHRYGNLTFLTPAKKLMD